MDLKLWKHIDIFCLLFVIFEFVNPIFFCTHKRHHQLVCAICQCLGGGTAVGQLFLGVFLLPLSELCDAGGTAFDSQLDLLKSDAVERCGSNFWIFKQQDEAHEPACWHVF